jgi:azurin
MPEATSLLGRAASDPHGRVRLTAAVAASYMPRKAGLGILDTAEQKEISKTYKQTYDFAREALNRMPAELNDNEGKVVQKSGILSDTKNLTTIRIATLVEKMKYDTPNLTVQAGKKVKLIFTNPDSMPHNIVLVNPGKADPVAMEAMNLGAKGFDLGFVPLSKEIIWASKLLNQSEEEVIEFDAPLKPDEYPYVCTFPGHHILMRGILKVVK